MLPRRGQRLNESCGPNSALVVLFGGGLRVTQQKMLLNIFFSDGSTAVKHHIASQQWEEQYAFHGIEGFFRLQQINRWPYSRKTEVCVFTVAYLRL